MTPFRWRSESEEPAPASLVLVGDALTADEAMKRVSKGEVLEYRGDFRNAKQLLSAMGRRLEKRRSPKPAKSALDAFRAERRMRQAEAETLARVVVRLDAAYRPALSHAPALAEACAWAWGPSEGAETVVPLKTLLGVLGAAEWRRRGLAVPGLAGTLVPHYGVYTPTRAEYVELVAALPGVKGQRVFDVGTGSGVLSFVLLQHGAASVVATDVDPRALACARENAARLGLADRFEAVELDGFPEGRADLVVCNPPWIPEPPKTRLDRAVFDDGGRFLVRFLEGLAAHLSPGGQGALVLSDLAVHLGLRSMGWLDAELERVGLVVAWKKDAKATHGKAKDASDPLHAARAKEVTTLYGLVPR